MPKSVRFRESAREDVSEAFGWYERQSEGLGVRFLLAVDKAVDFVTRNPESCPLEFDEFRRVIVERFPYSVFYEVSGNEVVIYGLLHHARDQDKWRKRAEETS